MKKTNTCARLSIEAFSALFELRSFINQSQKKVLALLMKGEEAEFFMNQLIALEKLVSSMPVTYQQDGKGDAAVVYLHYFAGGSDWYITEKDMAGGVAQAYGLAILNGDLEMAEMGYISIAELTQCGVEIDLYFKPCTLGQIKKTRGLLLEI
ncbi:MAG: hypothetical protein B7X60_02665 [Polynucleobacter sp. 39-45-136]|jgi:hypothetical protein|nr:MAG: hypothetical protein B7X60_02665 [Polynucleobacter sp. 39-45-136]